MVNPGIIQNNWQSPPVISDMSRQTETWFKVLNILLIKDDKEITRLFVMTVFDYLTVKYLNFEPCFSLPTQVRYYWRTLPVILDDYMYRQIAIKVEVHVLSNSR